MRSTPELDALRRGYMAELHVYGQLVGCIHPPVMYRQLLAFRERYAEAGGDLADLGELPRPLEDGRAPHIGT